MTDGPMHPASGPKQLHQAPRCGACQSPAVASAILPEVPKPLRGKIGVPNGVLDVLVPEVVLQAARIDARGGGEGEK
jgi:hypothetical protein